MSQATQVDIDDIDYDDVTDWATAAVRGANNWLVTIRNATDEGIEEWSDEFTGGRTGIMTYAEGLTALALTKQFAPVDRPDWQTLRDRYYREDFRYVLDEINHEDGPRFRPDPYLSGEDGGIETNNFTPSATFAGSVILESLKAGVDFGENIEYSEIETALETVLEWLLANKIDDEEKLETEDAAGWGWVGSESSHYDEMVRPSNYYTYSAVIVLSDLLQYRKSIDLVDRVVARHETELKEVLEEANEFLLNEYWEETSWTVPTGVTQTADDIEKLLSTCYAFIGLSYIAFSRDDIDMDADQKERMGKGMNWAISFYENDPYVWGKVVEYDCGAETELTFTDGSAPYVLLDSMVELLNFREGIIDHLDDFDRDEIETKAQRELAPTILDKCWAGDVEFEEKGFRHIANGDLLIQRQDGAPGVNMTAIYSTGVAMETFLLNFLEEGDLIQDIGAQEQLTDADDSGTDAESVDEGGTRHVENRTVNNIILDGESDDYPDEIGEQLENIQNEVSQLSAELGGDDGEASAVVIERTRAFMTQLSECAFVLGQEYSEEIDWKEDVCNDLGNAREKIGQSLQKNWPTKFKRKNTQRFVEYLGKLYFCPDRATYEDEVKLKDDYTLLLPPQRAIFDEVEEWDDDDFAETDARKTFVEEAVGDLTAEPWGGEDISDVIHAFEKRFKKEVIEG
jgi:hypothetical protein